MLTRFEVWLYFMVMVETECFPLTFNRNPSYQDYGESYKKGTVTGRTYGNAENGTEVIQLRHERKFDDMEPHSGSISRIMSNKQYDKGFMKTYSHSRDRTSLLKRKSVKSLRDFGNKYSNPTYQEWLLFSSHDKLPTHNMLDYDGKANSIVDHHQPQLETHPKVLDNLSRGDWKGDNCQINGNADRTRNGKDCSAKCLTNFINNQFYTNTKKKRKNKQKPVNNQIEGPNKPKISPGNEPSLPRAWQSAEIGGNSKNQMRPFIDTLNKHPLTELSPVHYFQQPQLQYNASRPFQLNPILETSSPLPNQIKFENGPLENMIMPPDPKRPAPSNILVNQKLAPSGSFNARGSTGSPSLPLDPKSEARNISGGNPKPELKEGNSFPNNVGGGPSAIYSKMICDNPRSSLIGENHFECALGSTVKYAGAYKEADWGSRGSHGVGNMGPLNLAGPKKLNLSVRRFYSGDVSFPPQIQYPTLTVPPANLISVPELQVLPYPVRAIRQIGDKCRFKRHVPVVGIPRTGRGSARRKIDETEKDEVKREFSYFQLRSRNESVQTESRAGRSSNHNQQGIASSEFPVPSAQRNAEDLEIYDNNGNISRNHHHGQKFTGMKNAPIGEAIGNSKNVADISNSLVHDLECPVTNESKLLTTNTLSGFESSLIWRQQVTRSQGPAAKVHIF